MCGLTLRPTSVCLKTSLAYVRPLHRLDQDHFLFLEHGNERTHARRDGAIDLTPAFIEKASRKAPLLGEDGRNRRLTRSPTPLPVGSGQGLVKCLR